MQATPRTAPLQFARQSAHADPKRTRRGGNQRSNCSLSPAGRPSQTVDMTASISATVAQESARDIIASKLASIAKRLEEERAASQLN